MKPIIKPKNTKKKVFNWAKIWSYLRTLFKNDSVVQCSIVPRAKNNHQGAKYWWISIPVFLMALGCALVPSTVQASKVTGSTMFSGGNHEFDRVLTDALTYDYKDPSDTSTDVKQPSYTKVAGDLSSIDIIDHKATFNGSYSPIEKHGGKIYYIGYHTSLVNAGQDNTEKPGTPAVEYTKDFDIYFVSGDGFNKNAEYILNNTFKYIQNPIEGKPNVEPVITPDNKNVTKRDCNYIIFGETKFIVTASKGLGQSPFIDGDYKHIANTNFKDYLLKDTSLEESFKDQQKFTKTVMKNYLRWSDEMFATNRSIRIGTQAGMSLAINGSVTILLGFIMWFLTRGKRNPNRYITPLETLNMAGWASLSPAILAMILGFIFPPFSVMGYLIFFGFRSMWLAMKYLRPQKY